MKVSKKRFDPVDKRQKIMRHAAGQFLRHGYEGCTMDLVAAKAKVGKQAIYEFFESKEHLFAEVTRARLAEFRIPAPRRELPAREAIERYLIETVDKAADPTASGLLRLNILIFRQHPALAAELHDGRRRGASELAAYLVSLGEGEYASLRGIDPLNFATRMAGVATEGVRHFLGIPWQGEEERQASARFSVRLFFDGCPCDGGQPDLSAHSHGPLSPVRPYAVTRLPESRFDELCVKALAGFLDHGFDGMSLDLLVAETGVSRATIYRQFGNKDGLFRYVLGREIDRRAAVTWLTPRASDFTSELEALAADVLAEHLSSPSIAMYRLLIREVKRVPDLAVAYYDSQIDRLREPLFDIFARHRNIRPCEGCVRAFHTLATFGVRFLTSPASLDSAGIAQLSRETARIMARPIAVD
mgnify:FL=1